MGERAKALPSRFVLRLLGRERSDRHGHTTISLVGGCQRDTQMLAGLADLTMTSSHIGGNPVAAPKVVNII